MNSHLCIEPCPILSNQKIAPDHYIIKIKAKSIAHLAKPGKFVQVSFCDQLSLDPLLPRPFSFLDQTATTVDILYQVVGRGTKIMSQKKKGDTLNVLGPFGNGWSIPHSAAAANTSFILVGGGVGIPPLYHLVKTMLKIHGPKIKKNIHIILGGRNKTLLHCHKNFSKLGLKVELSTDDGSKGHKGFVTELLQNLLQNQNNTKTLNRQSSPYPVPRTPYIYTCGPTPMLKAVSSIACEYHTPCEVSVEEPMACGFGACIGCAIELKDGTGTRYAMSCTEGPVFDATQIVWDKAK